MQRVFGAGFLWLFLFFVGCSRPPEIPVIEKSNPEIYPEIALRDTLTPTDFRQIFKAINQKGQLSGLKPWLETANDSDLTIVGKAINQYLYQDAFRSDGLPQLISARVQQKSFSQLNLNINLALKNFPKLYLPHLIQAALSHPSTQPLLTRSSFVFDPEWNKHIEYFVSPFLSQPVEQEQVKQFLDTTKKIIESPNFEEEYLALCESLPKSELAKNLNISLKQMEQVYGETVYSNLGQQIFRSFTADKNSNSIAKRLVSLAKLLNQPSSGLFAQAQETLKTEEGEALVRLLSERFETVIMRGSAGFIRETLNQPFDDSELNVKFWLALPRKEATDIPTENFTHLLRRIQFALEKMANSSRTFKDPHVTLNTFLLTRWFETMAKAHLQKIETMKEETFSNTFWQIPLQPFSFSINLLELDEKGKPIKDSNGEHQLSIQIENELKAVGMVDFASDLKWAVKQDSFGSTSTKIEISRPESNLMSSLRTVVSLLHRDHPIADPVPFLSSLAYLFSRAEEGSPLTLAQLESSNMLMSLQNFMRGLSFEQLSKLITFLFEDLSIGNISAEDRDRLKSLYPNNPETAELLDKILQSIQVVADLAQPDSSQVSLLELYHSFLSQSRLQDLTAISRLFGFLGNSGILELTNDPKSESTILLSLFTEEDFSKLLFLMGRANVDQQNALNKIFDFLTGKNEDDVKNLNSFLKEVILGDTDSITSLIMLTQQEKDFFKLSDDEKSWVYQLLNSNSFNDLYRVLVTQNSSKNLNQLISELETLSTNKDLEGMIKVLGNMKSERMQRLALALWDWEKSGELEAFFTILKTLTKS